MHSAEQVLAAKTPALLDFHLDLVSLELASKVSICFQCICILVVLLFLFTLGSHCNADTIEVFS